LSLARARVRAVGRLESAGVKPEEIDAGLEYNFWTQLELAGYVNDPGIRNPEGAYIPEAGALFAMRPAWRLEFSRGKDAAGSEFGEERYFSLLPPFWRGFWIDRIVATDTKSGGRR